MPLDQITDKFDGSRVTTSWFINLNPPFQTLLHKILVYVDSSDVCNDLGFNIGAGTSTVTRSWTIKVSGFY